MNVSFKTTSLIRALMQQYKFLCTISNNIEVYEEPVPLKKNCLTVQLNSRSVRRIELNRKAEQYFSNCNKTSVYVSKLLI